MKDISTTSIVKEFLMKQEMGYGGYAQKIAADAKAPLHPTEAFMSRLHKLGFMGARRDPNSTRRYYTLIKPVDDLYVKSTSEQGEPRNYRQVKSNGYHQSEVEIATIPPATLDSILSDYGAKITEAVTSMGVAISALRVSLHDVPTEQLLAELATRIKVGGAK